MTPIIAGTICGICVGTAWLVALIVVIVKRTKRKKRKRAGEDVDDDVPINASSTDPEGRPSRDIFIVPPDPAVLHPRHVHHVGHVRPVLPDDHLDPVVRDRR